MTAWKWYRTVLGTGGTVSTIWYPGTVLCTGGTGLTAGQSALGTVLCTGGAVSATGSSSPPLPRRGRYDPQLGGGWGTPAVGTIDAIRYSRGGGGGGGGGGQCWCGARRSPMWCPVVGWCGALQPWEASQAVSRLLSSGSGETRTPREWRAAWPGRAP